MSSLVTDAGRLVAAPTHLAGHLGRHGPLPPVERFLSEVAQAGLTGRGGAGFPAAAKLAAVRAHAGPAVVVGNGAEGEPASGKDRWLLGAAPHLVLDGLQLAAAATGAAEVYLYAVPEPDLQARLRFALAERSRAGLDARPVRLVAAAAGFLAGQETAVLRQLAGGPARPSYAPVRIAARGLGGRPTLLHNVETLAHLALIGRYGAAWFRAAGTPDEPGTVLTTVWPVTGGSWVAEHERGTPLAHVLGPVPGAAVLVGGYHGCWLPAPVARELRLCDADLKPSGAGVGAGVLVELPVRTCGLRETARVLRYLAGQSAGQCGPCLNGLPRIAGAFTALADGCAGPGGLADLQRWSALVVRRGACTHPDGSVRLVRSALQVFAPEVRRHLAGGCTASTSAPFLPLPAEPGR